ncbi:hypothetical protein HQ447_15180, partial [bacterium]|nr:hypothetical protein [bacterium]
MKSAVQKLFETFARTAILVIQGSLLDRSSPPSSESQKYPGRESEGDANTRGDKWPDKENHGDNHRSSLLQPRRWDEVLSAPERQEPRQRDDDIGNDEAEQRADRTRDNESARRPPTRDAPRDHRRPGKEDKQQCI